MSKKIHTLSKTGTNYNSINLFVWHFCGYFRLYVENTFLPRGKERQRLHVHISFFFCSRPPRMLWQEHHSDSDRSANSLLFDIISPVKVPTGKRPSAPNTLCLSCCVNVLEFSFETSDRWSEWSSCYDVIFFLKTVGPAVQVGQPGVKIYL